MAYQIMTGASDLFEVNDFYVKETEFFMIHIHVFSSYLFMIFIQISPLIHQNYTHRKQLIDVLGSIYRRTVLEGRLRVFHRNLKNKFWKNTICISICNINMKILILCKLTSDLPTLIQNYNAFLAEIYLARYID